MATFSVEIVRAGLAAEPPTFCVKKHEGSGGRYYRTFQDVYQGDIRIKEGDFHFFKCTKCHALYMVDTQKGTAKLNRHANVCDPLPGKCNLIKQNEKKDY